MPQISQALLLLSDGRLPAGGYAHSGGLETAIRLGNVTSMTDVSEFLIGRATTSGLVASAFAAAACQACREENFDLIPVLDSEFHARTPSPALRKMSLSLGRQLMRAWESIRPHPMQEKISNRLHQPVAFGASAAMLDLSPGDAARGLLHETLMTPAMAVVKLMRVDPFQAHRALAQILPLLDEVAEEAAAHAETAPENLPAQAAPLSDIFAEHHQQQEARLFAS